MSALVLVGCRRWLITRSKSRWNRFQLSSELTESSQESKTMILFYNRYRSLGRRSSWSPWNFMKSLNIPSNSYKKISTPSQWLRIFLYLLYNFLLYRVTRAYVEPSVSLFFCHKQCKYAEIKHLNIVFPATKYKLSHISKTKSRNVCPSTFFCWICGKKLELNNKNILDSSVIRSSINSRIWFVKETKMPIQPMNILSINSVKYITKTLLPKPFNFSLVPRRSLLTAQRTPRD